MNWKANKKSIVILLVVFVLAFAAAAFDKGSFFGLFNRTGRELAPKDSEETLFYTKLNACTSENVIERSGFAFKNQNGNISAVELASGVRVDIISPEGENSEYTKFSEYVSYIYLYDGEDLYRCGINGDHKVKLAEGVLDYELMGDYIYFLQEDNGENRLFRSILTGSNKKALFDFPVEAFLAYDGWLLMKKGEEGSSQVWREYNVLTQKSFDHRFDKGAHSFALDGGAIYYLTDEAGGGSALWRRDFTTAEDVKVAEGNIVKYRVGSSGIALLVGSGEGAAVKYIDKATMRGKKLEKRSFSAEDGLDLSAENIYVSDAGGTTHYSSVETEEWKTLP